MTELKSYYEIITVVNDISLIQERHRLWNRDLSSYIETSGNEILVPRSKSNINSGNSRWQVLSSIVSIVTDEEFLNPKENQIPLIFGSQMGVSSGGLKAISKDKFIQVAILGMSLLSGSVGGIKFGYINEKGNYKKAI